MENASHNPASLTQHALDAIKPSGFLGNKIRFFDKLTSTFDKIKEFPITEGLTVVCSEQTNGCGRLGRTWESDKGGIYFTFALTPPFGNFDIPFITIVCALGVCRALREYVPCSVKWPNDIVSDGKKICGILTKNLVTNGKIDSLLVGIGVNVNNIHFGVPHAESLRTLTDKLYDENRILCKILDETEYVYTNMNPDEILEQYKSNCINLGREVTLSYNDREITGTCTDILSDGTMAVNTALGNLCVHSGEVSVKGIYEKGTEDEITDI